MLKLRSFRAAVIATVLRVIDFRLSRRVMERVTLPNDNQGSG
jgi:hypothetical protein